jgi:Cu/Ag efflux protein CusF
MTVRFVASLVLACGLAATTAVMQTPAPVSKTASITEKATVMAIDVTSRTVTLKDEKGMVDTFSVGPEVTRFNEVKVGDVVKMTYYESVVLQVRKPGDPAPTKESTDAALTRAKSKLPAATLAVQDKLTVTVKAIDPATPSVTVTTSDGRTIIRKVEDKKNLTGLKVGDVIDITYTRALLTSIERSK